MRQLKIRESITLICDVKSLRNCQSFFIKMIIIFFVISVIIIFSVLAFTLFTPRYSLYTRTLTWRLIALSRCRGRDRDFAGEEERLREEYFQEAYYGR